MLLLSEDIWKSAGSGRIKADSQDFAECAKGIAVLVRDPVLTTSCRPQEYLLVGENVNMQVLDSTVSVKYSSMDKEVATVNSKGQITAVSRVLL